MKYSQNDEWKGATILKTGNVCFRCVEQFWRKKFAAI